MEIFNIYNQFVNLVNIQITATDKKISYKKTEKVFFQSSTSLKVLEDQKEEEILYQNDI